MKRFARIFASKAWQLNDPTSQNVRIILKLRPQAASYSQHSKTTRVEKPHRTAALVLDDDPTLVYGHSSGGWLWNEDAQLASRWREINHVELGRVAAEAVGSQCCTKMRKLGEGSFNKAFLLTMSDGQQVVARIPNPNAGFQHLTTASEVATMDYVRRALPSYPPRLLTSHSARLAMSSEYRHPKCTHGVRRAIMRSAQNIS